MLPMVPSCMEGHLSSLELFIHLSTFDNLEISQTHVTGSSSRLEALSNPTIFGKHEAHGYLSGRWSSLLRSWTIDQTPNYLNDLLVWSWEVTGPCKMGWRLIIWTNFGSFCRLKIHLVDHCQSKRYPNMTAIIIVNMYFGFKSVLLLFSDHHQNLPLVSPTKMQMQKCDKCSREFCSPVNYRRHIRVHHRLKKLDKVFLMSYK